MPKLITNGLTTLRVKNLTDAGTYSDGNGLTLRVGKNGRKSWVQRVTINGKARNIGLGAYPAVGLKEARERTVENLKDIRDGGDPVAEKRAAKVEDTIPTFQQAAERVIALRRPTWSSDRHAKQWTESLTNHAYPLIGAKRVTDVTPADALAVLTPIWNELPETSTRVRQRMATVFDWAIAQGLRTDNPANGSIDKALPRHPPSQAHHPAIHYADAPAALGAIRTSSANTVTKLAFEFMVLTAARAGEVRGATWDEIDLSKRTWTVPAARMKARKEHNVPLTDRAIEILAEAKELDRGNGLVFPSGRKGGALTNMAFTVMLRRLEIPAVPHGFRSTFKTWSIETKQDWAQSETALAHRLGATSVEAAYARTDLFEQRRALMEAWTDFLLKSALTV